MGADSAALRAAAAARTELMATQRISGAHAVSVRAASVVLLCCRVRVAGASGFLACPRRHGLALLVDNEMRSALRS